MTDIRPQRPLNKILTDETLNDREKFEEFVLSRACCWGSTLSKASDAEIVYLESWAGVGEFEGAPDQQKVWAGEGASDEQEIQAPGIIAQEVGLSGATYGEIARRMLDPSAEW
jgi:hypothetical protein